MFDVLRHARLYKSALIRAAWIGGLVAGITVILLGKFGGTSPLSSLLFPLGSNGVKHLVDFGSESPSRDARYLADWIAHSRDNANADFIIVDKRYARAYVFDAKAQLRGASPVLLGAARGDDSVPGIGLRPLSEVRPEERTTPAGRFVAESGRNHKGEDVVWVDYDAAVSMHRVRATKPIERRLERLATSTVDDNRISYGCINVPVAFYETHVSQTVAKQRAIIYVLPEIKPVQQVFRSYDVAAVRYAALKTH